MHPPTGQRSRSEHRRLMQRCIGSLPVHYLQQNAAGVSDCDVHSVGALREQAQTARQVLLPAMPGKRAPLPGGSVIAMPSKKKATAAPRSAKTKTRPAKTPA